LLVPRLASGVQMSVRRVSSRTGTRGFWLRRSSRASSTAICPFAPKAVCMGQSFETLLAQG